MATYLQGQQDYVTQTQPTKPNLQFDAPNTGDIARVSDAGHKKLVNFMVHYLILL